MMHTEFHPEINRQFGLFLKEAREKAGLSQSKVTKELGLKSHQSLSNIERGLCRPPLYFLKYLIDQYKISKRGMVKYLLEIEKLNLELQFGLIERPKKIKPPSTNSID